MFCGIEGNYKTIGLRLKLARELEQLTLAELAEESGVSLSTIKSIEKGQSNVRLSTLEIVCDKLKLSLSALFSKEINTYDQTLNKSYKEIFTSERKTLPRTLYNEREP